MAYYVRYLVQTNRLGKARPTLYVHTSNEDKDGNQIWYAFGTYETSPNLLWDADGETVAGSATASWSQEIARTDGQDSTPKIRASFDRTSMVLTLSSGSGEYDSATQTYAEPSGLFAEPAKFDCSNYAWSRGTANPDYAQLNADADFAVEAQEQEGGGSAELFPSDFTLYMPVINSAAQTDKREITVSWTASCIVGNKGTEVAPQLTLQYSADGGKTWVNSGVSVSGLTGTVAVRNLNAATVYYWRLIASWPTLGGSIGSNEDKFASTVMPLKPPFINSVTALDGEGSVSWGEVSGAVSYLVALVDSPDDTPASSVSSQGGTTWNFSESSGLTAGMTVQGKYVKVKAVATSNSIEYENSEWSEAKLIPDNRTPADEEPITPVEQIMTRRLYKAIPYIDVPVEQIGGGGSSVKDAITVEYANAHYVQSSGEIPASQLPFAVYGTTDSGSTTTVASPSYLESRITALGLGTAAGYAVGTAQGNIPVLGANGKLSIDMMPARVIGGEYLGEVNDQAAMVGKSNATVGDFVKRTDTGTYWMLGVDSADAYKTAANWFEYAGAVTSVNGAVGAVTQAQLGLETTLTAASDTAFPSSKAVAAYVTGRGYLTSGSNLNASKLSSGTVDAARLPWSLAAWMDGTTHWNTGGTGLVTATYLDSAFDDYGFGAAAKKGVATSVTSTGTDLVTAAAVYTAIDDLNLPNTYAQKTHTHTLGQIIYSGTTGYAAETSISSGSTAGQLATAKAVYDYTPLLTRLKWTANQAVAGVYTGDADAPSSEDYKIASAYAVKKWIDTAADSVEISVTAQYGLTYTNKTLAVTRANGTGTYGTVVQSAAANGLTIANGVISPTWASYATTGDRTSAVKFVNPAYVNAYIAANASVSGDAGKLVKFDDNGLIDALSILTDETYIYALQNGDEPAYLTINRDAIINGLASQEWATGRFAQSAALAPAWVSTGTYAAGDVVSYQGKLYRRTGSGSNPPGLLGSGWTEINLGQASRFDGTITGDGSATEFTVTHNLGTKDVEVSLIDDSTDQEVFAAVTMYSATQVKIGFGAAPESGKKYRVVVRR